MSFEPEQDQRKVAAYAGLPASRRFDLTRFPLRGELFPGGDGYVFVHWGVSVDPTDDPDPTWPALTAQRSSSPEWEGIDDDGRPVPRLGSGELVTYQLWLIQVYRPGYPLAAERRWHPDLDVRDAIVGLHEPHTQADVLAAHAAQRLIMDIQERRRGRDRDLDLNQAVRAYIELMGAVSHQATEQEVWDAVADTEDVHWSTVRSRWRRAVPPITIRDVRETAKKSAPELHL